MGVAKVRTTLVLEQVVLEKIRQDFGKNVSQAVNSLLRAQLFGKGKSMFGALKGKVSVKDLESVEDGDIHEDLYR